MKWQKRDENRVWRPLYEKVDGHLEGGEGGEEEEGKAREKERKTDELSAVRKSRWRKGKEKLLWQEVQVFGRGRGSGVCQSSFNKRLSGKTALLYNACQFSVV